MAGLHPARNEGRVNGLQRPSGSRRRRFRLARRHPVSLVAAGLGLYAVALVFPLVFRQVNSTVFAGALVGTSLLLAGLHLRWTRAGESRGRLHDDS